MANIDGKGTLQVTAQDYIKQMQEMSENYKEIISNQKLIIKQLLSKNDNDNDDDDNDNDGFLGMIIDNIKTDLGKKL